MSIRRITDENGVLRKQWDDSVTPGVYTEWDAQGVQVLTRAFNSDEAARAATDALEDQQIANERTIEQALADSLATLQAIIDDTNANINANPAQRIKDLARSQRRVIRLVIRRFDGSS